MSHLVKPSRVGRIPREVDAMNWLRDKLQGKKKGNSPPTNPGPWIQDLSHGVQVTVHLHTVATRDGSVACWIYFTQGLTSYGQAELVLGLQRDPGEETPPEQPLSLLGTICSLAAQGQLVGPGGYTGLKPGSGLFGRNDVTGLVYAPFPGLEGIPTPPGALSALPLVGEEFDLLSGEGPARLLARLGDRIAFYPFPAWFDRARTAASTEQMFQRSILARGMPVMRLWGLSVVAEGQRVLLRISPEAAKHLEALKGLPPDSPFALLGGIDPTADGCLVWQPGQTGPRAITPRGSKGVRLCGCFVVFSHHDEPDHGTLLEDGFGFSLSPQSFTSLCNALQSGEALQVASSPYQLQLEWIQPEPVRPDGTVRSHGDGPISMVLLNDDAYLREAGFEATAAADALAQVVAVLGQQVAAGSARQVDVRLELQPDRSIRVILRSDPDLGDGLDALGNALAAVPGPPLRKPVALEVRYRVPDC